MDRRERFNDLYETMIAALAGWQAGMWTALPGIVQSFNAVDGTVVVAPAIQGLAKDRTGATTWVDIPPLLDVPVIFMGGGGFVMTYPISAGDEALVVFSSRCIDNWFTTGGTQNQQADIRMHDLSDGFAIIGPRSRPRVPAAISADSAQIRSDDGATFVEVGPGSAVRVQADTVKAHARTGYSWDVNGYGQSVTYLGGNTWHVDNYQTPRVGVDTVVTTNHNISPPEAP